MSGTILAATLVGRKSLIGVCSFWPVNSRKRGEKVKSIGIDIGKRRCVVCVIYRNGTILETGYDNTYGAARSFAKKGGRQVWKVSGCIRRAQCADTW